ncbi:MAG: glycosyltransferase family 4 protein, partial [Desulfovibrio sp.]|nr:glycosyltransferase family 4 protein [Desulfovibrio sp.]
MSTVSFPSKQEDHGDCGLKTSPKVACLLLWYPLFTQPFIFREVEGLRKFCPLTVYTLYGKNLTHCSKEMLEVADQVETHGLRVLFSVVASMLKEICTQPRRFAKLFAQALLRRWPSLEIFGENLWAWLMGFYLAPKFVREKIEVIYAPWPRGTAQAAQVISQLTDIPFVITVRGDNLAPADPDLGEKMKRAAAVRANNAADQARIEAFGQGEARGKTSLIYNSLTLTLDQSPIQHILTYQKDRPLKIMALGRFDVTKGFDVLIKACALLRDQGLSATLTLAGGGGLAMGLGKLEGQLKNLCRELDLEDLVSFPGLISHNDLPALLAAHDIFAAPCVIDPFGRRDGIPNTVIEAMSLGLPIVASHLHALPEVIR